MPRPAIGEDALIPFSWTPSGARRVTPAHWLPRVGCDVRESRTTAPSLATDFPDVEDRIVLDDTIGDVHARDHASEHGVAAVEMGLG